MTQAFNLSQLANNLDSSGRLDATDGLVNAVPVANGGTGASSVAAAVSNLSASIYPVGSIYINAAVNTNPATLLGFGTWVAFGAGRVMVGLNASDTAFDTLQEIGGSKNSVLPSHNHFGETGPQLVNHTHNFNIGRNFAADKPEATGVGFGAFGFTNSNGYQDTLTTATESANHSHNFTTSTSGTDGTNGNLQPYITVCMWLRTA